MRTLDAARKHKLAGDDAYAEYESVYSRTESAETDTTMIYPPIMVAVLTAHRTR